MTDGTDGRLDGRVGPGRRAGAEHLRRSSPAAPADGDAALGRVADLLGATGRSEQGSLDKGRPAGRPDGRSTREYARVDGIVEGSVTSAVVRGDGSVAAEPCLWQRIEVLTALGDRLTNGGLARTGRDPLTSILAVIRAFDAVRSVNFEDGPVGFALRLDGGPPSPPAGPAGPAGSGARGDGGDRPPVWPSDG